MRRIAYGFLIGFLATIFLLQWYQKPQYPLALLLGLFGIFGILLIRKKILIPSILLGVSLALLSVSRTTHVPSPSSVDFFADGSRQTIEGIIVSEPDRRPLHTKYTLAIKEMEGRVLVSDYRNWPRYNYGDRIRATGRLEKPGDIDGFAYHNYLARYGIYAVMYRGSLTLIEKNKSPRNILYQLKESFEARLNRLYSEPHASFMAGLLTGSRKGIPENLMQAFNATGLTHIIAISGYNITIVIAVIAGSLFWLHPRYRLIPSIAAIAFFTVFVGASAAVVRAAIMGSIGLLALHCNRLAQVRLSLLWAAFCMTVFNPKILWYDAGFQLSFLAVVGVTELSPVLDPLFARVPKVLAMREALQMTVAAQLTAVPLIAVLFGRVSLIAPIANVLVAPVLPLAMLFGFLACTLSIISMPLALMVAYVGWGCLHWIITVAYTAAAIPFASVNLAIPKWMLFPYYLLLWFTIHTATTSFARKARERA